MTPLAYRHCFLQCKSPERCSIPIPHPSLIGTDGSPRQITTSDRKVVVVCPYCGLASAYSAQDVIEQMYVDKPSLFQAGECHLVAIEVECDGENCEARKALHVILGDEKGTWRPRVVVKATVISDSARCAADHRLRFDRSGKYRWTNLDESPF